MGTDTADRGHRDEVSLHIEAPPETLWDMVADITRMGSWSPECTGGRWIGGERRPVTGARFLGFNRRGLLRWLTPNVVEEAERGRTFMWRTISNGNRWGYDFEPEGNGTRVTEFRQLPSPRPLHARLALLLLGGVERYDAGVPEGMRRTLERLRVEAEDGRAAGTDG